MKIKSTLFRSLPAALLLTGALSSFSQTLTVTNGMQLWLRADAGVSTNTAGGVTQWEDQSGNANNAAQADDNLAPTLVNSAVNNKPVLRFDGVNDYLEVADSESVSISGDITTFFVVNFSDFATYRAVWAKTAVNYPAPNDWYALPGSGIPRAYRGDGSTAAGHSGFVDGGVALRANSYLVVGWDMAGTNLTHYLAAQPTASGQITAVLGDADTSLLIGSRGDLFTKMKGDIAEILIYDTALSAADRAAVVDYLGRKYNIQNLPPTVSVKLTPTGPNVSVGQTITVTATANDPDGTIGSVEFLVNGGLFATATAAPFTARVVLETAGAYVFTARAIDDKSASTTSAATTINAGPASTPSLSVKDNLQLWLEADAGVTTNASGAVTTWADQSGKMNNAAQTDDSLAPAFVSNAVNGKPSLRFDGMDDYLEVADSDSVSIAGDITSLFVVKMDDFATYRAVWAKTGGAAGNYPAPNDWYALPNSGIPSFLRGNGTSAGGLNGASALRAGIFEMAGFTAAGTAVSHFLNGHVNGTGVIGALLEDGDTPLKIGTRQDLFTKMKGDIAEILIYSSALSDSDRKQAELYLAGKYGLAISTTVNTLPTVNITAPVIGAVLQAPGAVTITANAADSDGSVVSVQFFADGTLLGTVNKPPFTTNLNLTYGGVVNISAVATDNLGGRSVSANVPVCAQGPGAPAGLVGYWPLDGNGAAMIGTAGNLINAPIPASDRNGAANLALSFDGTQLQRVEIPGGGGLNAARLGTISMWVKWTGPQDAACCGGFGAVLGRQSNGIFSDDLLILDTGDPDSAVVQWRQNSCCANTIVGTTVVLNDTWRHIAVTFTETNSELFVNGVSEGTGAGGALHNNPNLALAIGAWNGDGGSYATATIDDVAVWSRVLSAQEVGQLAAQSRTPLNLLVTPDCLTIERSGANTLLRWGSSAVLQTSPGINGGWTDLLTATSPYPVPAAGTKYYRLRSP